MKRILLLLICFLTVAFGFSQTETISIPWDFFVLPSDDPNFGDQSIFDSRLTIEEGDTVEWTWLTGGHNVKSEPESAEAFGTPGGEFDTFPEGHVYSHTFTVVGVNNFICAPHESLMYGSITVVPEGTLSVSNPEISNFSISPNPAKNSFTLDLEAYTSDTTINVYDVLGKKVFSKTLSAMRSSIDISKWNSGMYLVRITTADKTLTKRFVKQ